MTNPNAWRVATLREVAEFFNVELSTVKGWRAARDPMPGAAGAWPIDKIVQWRAGRVKPEAARKAERVERKLDLEIADRQLRLQNLAAGLVSSDAADEACGMQHERVKARLETIPEEMVAGLPLDLQADSLATWRHKIGMVCKQINDFSLPSATKPGRPPGRARR